MFKFIFIQVTWSNSQSNEEFNLTGSYMLKYRLEIDRPVFNRAFFKDNKLLALHTCRSNLFHCEKVYGNNEYLKTKLYNGK